MLTTQVHATGKAFVCKQLAKLPPVVSDWQQSCLQPCCSHFCDGACCNTGRQTSAAACPYDDQELLLVDADAVLAIDRANFLQGLPKKG